MNMSEIPFGTTDWSKVPRTEHKGERGTAYWRTLDAEHAAEMVGIATRIRFRNNLEGPVTAINRLTNTLQVMGLDAATGKIQWTQTAYEGPMYDDRHKRGSYAAPTPVTDGERVYAYFGSAIMAGQVMLNIPMAFIGAVAAERLATTAIYVKAQRHMPPVRVACMWRWSYVCTLARSPCPPRIDRPR